MAFRVLSIDGGGIRGVFPAHILYCIAHRLGLELCHHFDMIAGVSTGSIVAAAVSCKIDLGNIVSMYRKHGPMIFSRRKSWLPARYQPAFQSLYDNEALEIALIETFGETKMGQIQTPLLLPATDIGNGGVHVFKSPYQKDYDRDGNVPLHRAILASCSAPTYFNPTKVNEYLLADGGLWANNPSLAVVIDARRRLNVDLSDIRILSLGTGLAKTSYGVKLERKWGLLNGWRGKELISFLMSLQAQTTHNYLQLMLREDQIFRLNFESDGPLPLDDCSQIDDLISRADMTFTHNSAAIKRFLNIKEEGI